MLSQRLIDGIIEEPLGGAHTNPEQSFANVRAEIIKQLKTLSKLSPEERINQRIEKFCAMGVVVENEEVSAEE